ncbi:MAG: hypothetical protein ACRDLU_00330 [Gaiellaceae bacterium]
MEVHWLGRLFLDFVEEALAPLGYRASLSEASSYRPIPTDPMRS